MHVHWANWESKYLYIRNQPMNMGTKRGIQSYEEMESPPSSISHFYLCCVWVWVSIYIYIYIYRFFIYLICTKAWYLHQETWLMAQIVVENLLLLGLAGPVLGFIDLYTFLLGCFRSRLLHSRQPTLSPHLLIPLPPQLLLPRLSAFATP